MSETSTRWLHAANSRRGRFIVAAIVLLLIIFVWRWIAAPKHDDHPKPTAVVVGAAVATRVDVPVYLEGIGSVQAFNTVTITPRVDGELQKVGFVEGQDVKKGDLLAQIDPRPYKAALEQAQATKAKDEASKGNAEQDLARYNELAPEDLTSKQTVDTQRALVAQLAAQIKGDQAAIDNAQTQLDYTTITAPIPGRTGIRLVDAGNNVHASDTAGIVVLTQLQPISLIFTVPEDSLPSMNAALAKGPVAVVALSRDGQTTLDKGTIALVDNQIDPTTATVRVKATFPNKSFSLWPGQFINARAQVEIQQRALTIPSAALQRGPNGLFSYVINASSKVEVRQLNVSSDDGTIAVIAGGLQEGEQVVTRNQYRLQPDALVRIDDGKNKGQDFKDQDSKAKDSKDSKDSKDNKGDKAVPTAGGTTPPSPANGGGAAKP